MQIIADYLSISAGLCIAWGLYLVTAAPLRSVVSTYDVLAMANVVAALSLLYLYALSESHTEVSPMDILESERLARSALCVLATATVYSHTFHPEVILPYFLLVTAAVVVCSLVIQRALVDTIKRHVLRMGVGVSRVAIFGQKHTPQSLEPEVRWQQLKWEFIGNVHDHRVPEVLHAEHRVLGCWAGLDSIVSDYNLTDVVVPESDVTPAQLESILQDCLRLHLGLSLLESCPRSHSFESGSNGSFAIRRLCGYSTPHPIGTLVKRVFDILLSITLLVLLFPMLLAVAALVAVDSPGPIFFRHVRVGKDGRTFRIWKFRSMHKDAPMYERSPSSDADLRLTRLGRILRRFSIDELPQLFNVINGDMSLVGPRPEMPFVVDQYGPLERRRLQVLPGMTGLWQISPARALPIHAHMEYDLFYIERQNIFLDIAILCRTFGAVLRPMEPLEEASQPKMRDIPETRMSA